MNTRFITILSAAVLTLLVSPGMAQQKTAKACRDEWKANKADFQAKKITEKAYVTDCLAGKTAAQPAAAPVAPAPKQETSTKPAAAPVPTAQQKTAKACRDEWKANKADFQAKKITEKAYVADCLAGKTAAQPATAPVTTAPAPKQETSTKPAAAPAPMPSAKPAPSAKQSSTAATAPTAANQFTSEALAKAHCPSDTVVWVNLSSKIYHFSGNKSYGTTKTGAYVCEKDATGEGFRAAKNEKHP